MKTIRLPIFVAIFLTLTISLWAQDAKEIEETAKRWTQGLEYVQVDALDVPLKFFDEIKAELESENFGSSHFNFYVGEPKYLGYRVTTNDIEFDPGVTKKNETIYVARIQYHVVGYATEDRKRGTGYIFHDVGLVWETEYVLIIRDADSKTFQVLASISDKQGRWKQLIFTSAQSEINENYYGLRNQLKQKITDLKASGALSP